jgi:predicted RNA-binding Zn-ribbon protein involved in translation (DUF1610 family)
LRQRISQQIRAYKLDISQTKNDGSFLCPNCGEKISPDDQSGVTYTIGEIKLRKNNLDEVIIHCGRCLSFIYLSGFYEIDKKK